MKLLPNMPYSRTDLENWVIFLNDDDIHHQEKGRI